MLEDGWKSIGKVFVLALVLDVAYQMIANRFVYVGEAVVVACVLAIVPYLLLRGLVNRISRRA
jgi:formate-dependent nitrite reductase membrane component NrfD